jgi:hypothetical protein
MPTTLTYHTLTPVETAPESVESAILGELAAHPPDRVAIVTRNVREFGYRGFGIDYDLRIAAWLRAHYREEGRWGGERFQLVLLRR